MSDPDGRDQHGGPITAATVSKLISRALHGVSTKPSITECCIYTVRLTSIICIGFMLLYIHKVLSGMTVCIHVIIVSITPSE